MSTATSSTAATEQRLDIHCIDWDRYLAISEAMPEQAGARLIYVDGELSIVTTSRLHDWHAEILSRIVEALTWSAAIPLAPARTSTYRDRSKAVAVEGDAAFYLGENALLMQGSKDVDLSVQPPPDLVVEVERTNPADQAILAWGRLGVPEVWLLDVERMELRFLTRPVSGGGYAPASFSSWFPPVTPSDLIERIQMAEATEYNRWRHDLADWADAKFGSSRS